MLYATVAMLFIQKLDTMYAYVPEGMHTRVVITRRYATKSKCPGTLYGVKGDDEVTRTCNLSFTRSRGMIIDFTDPPGPFESR